MTPLQAFVAAARRERIENPTLGEQIVAMFQRENTVGMTLDALNALSGPNFTKEEGFNPVEHMTLPELEDPRKVQAYTRARSMAELEYLRKERRRLEELDAIVNNGPLGGIAAALIAGILDPINLVPLGWAMRGARTAEIIAGAATVGATGHLLTEPFRYAADPFRMIGDTLADTIAAGALGGALGGAVVGVRYLASGRSRLAQAYEAAGIPKPEADQLARAVSDAYTNAARVAAEAAEGPQARVSTVGAVRFVDEGRVVRDVLRDEFLTVGGPRWLQKMVKALGDIPFFRYPSASLVSSASAEARKFAYAFEDVGILPRAVMGNITDDELRKLHKKAVEKGYQGGEDDFIAAARRELESGLALSETGTWRANYDMLRISTLYPFLDKAAAVSQRAVSAKLVKTEEDFAEAVGQHLRFLEEPDRFGGVSPLANNPALLEAAEEVAKAWRENVAKPMLKAIQDSGIWADDPITAEAMLRDLRGTYFPRVFDHDAIAADPVGFRDALRRSIMKAVFAARDRLYGYERAVREATRFNKVLREWQKAAGPQAADSPVKKLLELARAAKTAGNEVEKIKAEIISNTKQNPPDWIRTLEERKALGDTIGEWELGLLKQYEDAVSRFVSRAAEYNNFREANLANLRDLAGSEPPVFRTVRPKPYAGIEKDRALLINEELGTNKTDAEFQALADELAQKFISNNRDPVLMTQTGLRSYLRQRQADLNPVELAPYMETNAARIADMYVSTISRDIALQRVYGTYKADDILAKVQAEYNQMIEAAKKAGDNKRAEELAKEARKNNELIRFFFSHARGQFDVPTSRGQQRAREAAFVFRTAAFTEYMGSAAIAQIGDITTSINRASSVLVFKNAIESIVDGITRSARGLTKEQLTEIAVAVEYVNLTRTRALYDIAPQKHMTVVGQSASKLANVFSRLTLMPTMNDFWRKVGVRVADSLLTKMIATGKVPRDLRTAASQAGVTADQLQKLANILKEYRIKVDPKAKVWDSNLEAWFFKEPELGEAYRRLLHVSAQRMVIQPGAGDSPIWTQKWIGSTVVQFKRFVIASIPQILVPWLQSPAGRFVETFIAGVLIGSVVLTLQDLNRYGKVKERDTVKWIFDALDMSGLLSGLTEADATLDRLVPGLGIKRMLTGEDYTRMQERSWLYGKDFNRVADLVGVSARVMANFLTATAIPYTVATRGEPTEAQIRAFRELLPFQNQLVLRHFFDMLEWLAGGRKRSVLLNAFGEGGTDGDQR